MDTVEILQVLLVIVGVIAVGALMRCALLATKCTRLQHNIRRLNNDLFWMERQRKYTVPPTSGRDQSPFPSS